MTADPTRVRRLADALTADELNALAWAARFGSSVLVNIGYGPDSVRLELHDALTPLQALLAEAAVVARLAPADPTAPIPTPCTSCGTTIEACDQLLIDRRPPCCGDCAIHDTHNDRVDGLSRRHPGARSIPEPRPDAGRTPYLDTQQRERPDAKAVADAAIARGALRPRGT